jgi:hypothetical protein
LDHGSFLHNQSQKQVAGGNLLMISPRRQNVRVAQRLLGFNCEFFYLHKKIKKSKCKNQNDI